MLFPSPLRRGVLVRRYKRFFADIELEDGGLVTAHCPNPGAMIGMAEPGLRCWVSHDPNPKRKLPYTWELVDVPSVAGKYTVTGLNTLHPNRLVAEALAADAIPELSGYASHRREVRYGAASRVDFLLEGPGRPSAWLEVKGVTLHRGQGLAEWPDCVSARGARHVAELAEMARLGDRAVVLFVVQRADCDRFAVAGDLDPAFAAAFDRVRAEGVEALVYDCEVTPERVALRRALAV